LFASALFAQKPFQNGQAARAVVGQITFTKGDSNPSQQVLGGASGIAWAGNRLYVADSNRIAATPQDNRVVVFDTTLIPNPYVDLTQDTALFGQPYCFVCGTAMSLTLGQDTFLPPTFIPSGSSSPVTGFYNGINGTTDPASSSTPEHAWFNNATAVASDGIRLAVADTDNNRVLIWNSLPTKNNQNPDLVLGQPDFKTVQQQQLGVVTATAMRGPQGVWIQNNRLYVADTQNYRVLIWNTFPKTNNQAPDVVLGQPDFMHANGPTPSKVGPPAAANQLLNPVAVTVDNSHVFVADLGFNRVLIWNTTTPTTYQNADVVVGQADFIGSTANNPTVCPTVATNVTTNAPCAYGLNYPRFALSDGTRLFIADGGNDRVLIYNHIPTTNGVAADNVLGQISFTTDEITSQSISIVSTQIDNTGAVDTTPSPTSLAWDGTNLYVADPFNRRILIFTAGDSLVPSASDPTAKIVPVVNWASEIVRQEGTVALTLAAGGKITANDTATITIQGTAYMYTEKSSDTLDGIARALVKMINASDPNVTASFAGAGTGTIYLSSLQTNLGYDTITLAASTSNTANVVATASGSYLSAGNAATASPGALVEINAPPGVTFSDSSATAQLSGRLPNTLAGVQVYLDGIASPLLKVTPTQIVGQIPYFFGDRNSTSVYVRTVHNNGSVTVTNATPVYIAPANPGIFNAPEYPRQTRPWPASMAFHQPGNPTAVVSVDGSVSAKDTATITIGSNSYTYTVVSTDTLTSITQSLINAINAGAGDPNVIASVGGAFTRVVLTARLGPFSGGNGISVGTSTSTGASVTLTAYNPSTCCAVQPGTPIYPGNPAVPGELIYISTAGLGAIVDANANNITLDTGVPFPGSSLNTVYAPNFVAATMGGSTAQVIYAGLPNGSYGIYQVGLIVPTSLTPLSITPTYIAQNAFISNTVYVAVGNPVTTPPPPPGTVSTPAIFMNIDSPGADTTVSGSIFVGGWALDTKAPIQTATMLVDGISYGNAGYGGARPDACAAIAGGIGCPNVGFTGVIDTTGIGNGVHTFQVTVTDSAGGRYTSAVHNVTVSNNYANYPTHVNIDLPSGTGNEVYHGLINFSGWAVNDSALITSFTGSIDGTPINGANVVYGAPRADVCAAGEYPGRPGCPNVGWSYLADLTRLGNGTHTFTITAIAANGQQFSALNTFVVNNGVTSTTSTGPSISIDTPSTSSGTLSGTATVGGWAVDPFTNIYNVSLSVDGVSLGNLTYGGVRNDVCTAFSNPPGCPNVGFNGSFDTTQFSDGTHTLAVTATPAAGQAYTFTRTITIGNTNTGSNKLRVNIDTPSTSGNSTLAGQAAIGGWALSDNQAISVVTISVDGVVNGTAVYGGARPDVCSEFPSRPGCPNVGWTYTLDTTKIANGSHNLEVTATTTTGQRGTVGTAFMISNSGGAAMTNIDLPNPTTHSYSGIALTSGSAYSPSAHIISVAISIDGVPVGTAAYGKSRPDVCTSTTVSPDCPNVGWTYALDTTLLTDGAHTMDVLSTAADGTHSTASVAFTVANWTAPANPMVIIIDTPNGAVQTPYVGANAFGGWILDQYAHIKSVSIAVDGIPFGNAIYGGPRPDVCTSTSVGPDCPNVGWNFVLDTTYLSNDVHTLTVTGTTVNGQSSTVSQQFSSSN